MIIFAFQLARSSFQKPNLPVGRKKTSDDRFCSSVCAIAKEKNERDHGLNPRSRARGSSMLLRFPKRTQRMFANRRMPNWIYEYFVNNV
jgi:uncharacterized membrane protein (UPF0127 family)